MSTIAVPQPAPPTPAPTLTNEPLPPPSHTDNPEFATLSFPDPSDEERGRGKIDHLPRYHRDAITRMLDDGKSYRVICAEMAERDVFISPSNLSSWFHGGYQAELAHRERLLALERTTERLLELGHKDEGPSVALVGLQLAVTQFAQQLSEMKPGAHAETFQTDTKSYLRMVGALSRTSKALLSLRKYLDRGAKDNPPGHPMLDPHRKLSEEETGAIVDHVDQAIFGFSPRLRAKQLAEEEAYNSPEI